MNLAKFNATIPYLEGLTIGDLRMNGGEVIGFVLKDKKGEKKYILYFGKDLKVVLYW